MGLKTQQLTTEKLVNLFYNIYNPRAHGQQFAEAIQYKTPLTLADVKGKKEVQMDDTVQQPGGSTPTGGSPTPGGDQPPVGPTPAGDQPPAGQDQPTPPPSSPPGGIGPTPEPPAGEQPGETPAGGPLPSEAPTPAPETPITEEKPTV